MYKYILTFIGGAVAGATVSYICAKKKIEARCEEEIASVKEYAERKIARYKNDADKSSALFKLANTEVKTPRKIKTEQDISEAVADLNKSIEEAETTLTDYTKYFGNKKDDEEEELEEHDDDYHASMKLKAIADEEDRTGIFRISDEEFGELPVNDSQSLFYYTVDGVLSNEEDEEIDDWDAVVGDILDTEGFFTDSNMTSICIRNMNLGCDYEVIKVASSFSESRVLT